MTNAVGLFYKLYIDFKVHLMNETLSAKYVLPIIPKIFR